jgi:hypothetical protein
MPDCQNPGVDVCSKNHSGFDPRSAARTDRNSHPNRMRQKSCGGFQQLAVDPDSPVEPRRDEEQDESIGIDQSIPSSAPSSVKTARGSARRGKRGHVYLTTKQCLTHSNCQQTLTSARRARGRSGNV